MRLLTALTALILLALWLPLVPAAHAGEEPPAATETESDADRADPIDAAEQAVLRSVLDAQERKTRADNFVRRGKELMEARRYADALELFRNAIRLDPANDAAREGEATAKKYLEARTDERTAVIPREISRVKVGEQHTQMEALNYIQNAEYLIQQATAPLGSASTPKAQASALVERLRLLDESSQNLHRATLALNSLPARLNPAEDRKRVAVLDARVRGLREQFSDRLQESRRQIALVEKQRAQTQAEEYLQRQKKTLIRRAEAHKDLYEFDKAEQIVLQVLDTHPTDPEAISLLEDIRRRRRVRRDQKISDMEVEERERVIENIDRMTVANVRPGKVIDYPENWDELTKRKNLLRRTTEQVDEESRKIKQKLRDRHTVEFEQQDVRDVLDHLRDRSGINIIPNLPGEDTIPPITLRVQDMRLDHILDWIMRITGLKYEIRDGVVHVTSSEDIGGGMVTEVYDVRDLIVGVSDSRQMPEDNDDDDDDDDDDLESSSIQEIIERVMPQFFDGGDGSVELDDVGNLTVRQTPAVQTLVQELLGKLRAAQAIQVSVSARFLTITDDFWEQFNSKIDGFDGFFNNYLTNANEADGTPKVRNPNDPAFTPSEHFDNMFGLIQHRQVGAIFSVLGNNLGSNVSPTAGLTGNLEQVGWLGQIQANWFVRAVKESAKADELFNPHIIVYNNRYGWFRSQTEIPYIHTYILAPAGVDLEPVIAYLETGTSLQVRPIVSADKKYITLDLYPRVRKLLSMSQVSMVGLTTGHDLPIDLPTIFEHNARTYATLPDGGAILLSGMAVNVHMRGRNGIPLLQDVPVVGNIFSDRAYQKEKRNFVIMVNARMVLLDEEEAKQTR